ncbi:hypothetical protein [Amycolatopsis sp. cmx-4-83]|uniref:hypothetical protein n=1 Tax=Amycolatopsis sp. cmx-4-83 TaxID=2790940 RepID=UPI00397D5213
MDDVLTVFDSDRRVQLVHTIPGASAAESGVEHELNLRGAVVLPWQQALTLEFDLAISVHNSGNLHEIAAPLAVLSHGIGYTKYFNRTPDAGRRTPDAGRRTPDVYGLSAQSLLQGGAVVPTAIILTHDKEIERLAAAVPAAVPAAVVGGDPCFDRLLASSAARNACRERLDAGPNQTVVFVSSTWGPRSLFGRFPELLSRVLADLDLDSYVVSTALHPNVWYAHGPAQIELWLGDCLRAGLRLVPPTRGWQQALLAADVVIGDHGAVTGYAAALGKPVLLATFPENDVVADSAIGALGRHYPRLDQHTPLVPQLLQAVAPPVGHREIRSLATSAPGDSADRLRSVFYNLMTLPEPTAAALVPAYEPEDLVPARRAVRAWWAVTDTVGDRTVRLDRWPADVTSPHGGPPAELDGYLVVASDHPRRDLHALAAVVLTAGNGPEPAAVFGAQPVCRLVVQSIDQAHCRITKRSGETTVVQAFPEAAAALLPWFEAGRSLGGPITVHIGRTAVEITAVGQDRL